MFSKKANCSIAVSVRVGVRWISERCSTEVQLFSVVHHSTSLENDAAVLAVLHWKRDESLCLLCHTSHVCFLQVPNVLLLVRKKQVAWVFLANNQVWVVGVFNMNVQSNLRCFWTKATIHSFLLLTCCQQIYGLLFVDEKNGATSLSISMPWKIPGHWCLVVTSASLCELVILLWYFETY